MVTELNLLNPLKSQVPDDDIIGDEEEEEEEEEKEEEEEEEDLNIEPGTKKEEEDYLE